MTFFGWASSTWSRSNGLASGQEIWWADLQEPTGRRAVLLLSRSDAYDYLSKFIAVEVTSNIRRIASELPLGKAEGLPKPCVANCDNLRVVPRVSLTRRAGELAPERRVEAKRALGAALGWRELTDLD